MASPNSTFTEMVTTTLRHHKKTFADNVSKHNALLRWMKDNGNIKTEAAGGYEIVLPLDYQENSTYQRYSGYDLHNIGASDVLSAAKYDWMQAAIYVTSNGREIKMNASEERLINLVKSRVKNAMSTASNNMSIDIYSDGALSNQIGGLGALVTSDGTGTVGGINSTTYTFWKNKFKEVSGTGATFATLKAAMNEMLTSTTRGNDRPDLIVMTHDFYNIYIGGLQDLQRYTSSRAANLGFAGAVEFQGIPVIFDDNTNFGTTSEIAYMLNTKHLYLMEHPEARWTEEDEKIPVNQDAVVVPMYWMGNLCTDWRAGQAKIIDAA